MARARCPAASDPFFIKRPEDVDRLIWNEHCHHNLSVYAAREIAAHPGKVALVVKGCDELSISRPDPGEPVLPPRTWS